MVIFSSFDKDRFQNARSRAWPSVPRTCFVAKAKDFTLSTLCCQMLFSSTDSVLHHSLHCFMWNICKRMYLYILQKATTLMHKTNFYCTRLGVLVSVWLPAVCEDRLPLVMSVRLLFWCTSVLCAASSPVCHLCVASGQRHWEFWYKISVCTIQYVREGTWPGTWHQHTAQHHVISAVSYSRSPTLSHVGVAICIFTITACSTVVAQDHRRSRLSRCHGKGLECAAAGDHVAAIAGGIQACTEDGTVPQIIRQRKLSATAALTLQL